MLETNSLGQMSRASMRFAGSFGLSVQAMENGYIENAAADEQAQTETRARKKESTAKAAMHYRQHLLCRVATRAYRKHSARAR